MSLTVKAVKAFRRSRPLHAGVQKGVRTGTYSDAADMKLTVGRCAQAALHAVLRI